MKNYIFIVIVFMSACIHVHSQEDITYQTPSKEIAELIDVQEKPDIWINEKGNMMILLYSHSFKSLAELSEKEMRLGGAIINPITHIEKTIPHYNDIKLMNIGDKSLTEIKGLPEKVKISFLTWSPDQSKLAFTNTTEYGVELWILNLATAAANKITEAQLNASIGSPYTWNSNGESLLVKFIPVNRKELIDKDNSIPKGPRVSVTSGTKAQNRTFQNLLEDKIDEYNFEQLTLSELYEVSLTGEKTFWKEAKIYSTINYSSDGNYVLVSNIEKPFSYLVTYDRFPNKTTIYNTKGEEVKIISEVPLIEELPSGFDVAHTGKRFIEWRSDKPATLTWVKALDGGDAKVKAEYREELLELEAPFTDTPRSLIKLHNRYYDEIFWGNDHVAIIMDKIWNTRNTKMYVFNPSDPKQEVKIISDRNLQDKYTDPGLPVMTRNKYGYEVLLIEENNIFLSGEGFSEDGVRPFIDKLNIPNNKKRRMWQADGNSTYESIIKLTDAKKGELITRIESPNDFPNYFIRNIKKGKEPTQITFFENPYISLAKVQKKVIKYKREDGVELSGNLYLPANYDTLEKEKLPMVLWAYPLSFKDKKSAGQISSSPYKFTQPSHFSPIFWALKGYVVLDEASFPIIGENNAKPNDTFVPQLIANAKAAIQAVDDLGYIDKERVALGGHSYGAFMTANLLTHSDLFVAGMALSGAYNRTLTPFGFQVEDRTYWQAPEIYNAMSPFMHADKMKHALLLIHGDADNNSGTFSMQSERYFNALKGLGANARLVMLPKEAHRYYAKESILHVLWEQEQWLDKWLNKIKSN